MKNNQQKSIGTIKAFNHKKFKQSLKVLAALGIVFTLQNTVSSNEILSQNNIQNLILKNPEYLEDKMNLMAQQMQEMVQQSSEINVDLISQLEQSNAQNYQNLEKMDQLVELEDEEYHHHHHQAPKKVKHHHHHKHQRKSKHQKHIKESQTILYDNNEEDYDEKVDEKTLEKVADSQENQNLAEEDGEDEYVPPPPMKSEQISEAHKARIEAQKKEIFDNYQTVAEHGGESKIVDADIDDDIDEKEKKENQEKLKKKSSQKHKNAKPSHLEQRKSQENKIENQEKVISQVQSESKSQKFADLYAQAILHQQQKQGATSLTEQEAPAQSETQPSKTISPSLQSTETMKDLRNPSESKEEENILNKQLSQKENEAKDIAVQKTLEKIKGKLIDLKSEQQMISHSNPSDSPLTNQQNPMNFLNDIKDMFNKPILTGPSPQAAPVPSQPISKSQINSQIPVSIITEISFNNRDQKKQQIKEDSKQNWVNPFSRLSKESDNNQKQLSSQKHKNPLSFLTPPQTSNVPSPITNYAQPSTSQTKNTESHSKKQENEESVNGFKIVTSKLEFDDSMIKVNSTAQIPQPVEKPKKSKNIDFKVEKLEQKIEEQPSFKIETTSIEPIDEPVQQTSQHLSSANQTKKSNITQKTSHLVQKEKKSEESTSFKIETTVATPQMFKKLLGDDSPDEEEKPAHLVEKKNSSQVLSAQKIDKKIKDQASTVQKTSEIIKENKQEKKETLKVEEVVSQAIGGVFESQNQTAQQNQHSNSVQVSGIINTPQENNNQIIKMMVSDPDWEKPKSPEEMRLEIQRIINSIQPALQQAIGKRNNAKVQIIISENTDSFEDRSKIMQVQAPVALPSSEQLVKNQTIQVVQNNSVAQIVQAPAANKSVALTEKQKLTEIQAQLEAQAAQKLQQALDAFTQQFNKLQNGQQSEQEIKKKEAVEKALALAKIQKEKEQAENEKHRLAVEKSLQAAKEKKEKEMKIQEQIRIMHEKEKQEELERLVKEQKEREQIELKNAEIKKQQEKQKKDDLVQRLIKQGKDQQEKQKQILQTLKTQSDLQATLVSSQSNIKDEQFKNAIQKTLEQVKLQKLQIQPTTSINEQYEDESEDLKSIAVKKAIELAKERQERASHPLSGSLFKTLGSTLGTIQIQTSDEQGPIQIMQKLNGESGSTGNGLKIEELEVDKNSISFLVISEESSNIQIEDQKDAKIESKTNLPQQNVTIQAKQQDNKKI